MPVREKSGKLFFDFTWQGVRCKEYTGLPDTAENRRRCQHTMRLVDAAIRRGDFDYRAFFPRGSRLHVFHPDASLDGLMMFQDYLLRWHRLRSPFRGDGTVVKDADLHPSTWLHDESTIRRHLIPAFGPFSLREVDVARVNEFRRQLMASGITGKSVTNIIGTLHKVMTDATREGLISLNPVLRIRSGRRRRAGARIRSQSDPLTPAEITAFLSTVPGVYRTFYDVCFAWAGGPPRWWRCASATSTSPVRSSPSIRVACPGSAASRPSRRRVRARSIAPTTRRSSRC
jgi:integrase